MTQQLLDNIRRGLKQTRLFTEEEQERLLQLSTLLSNQSVIIRDIYVSFKMERWPLEYKLMFGGSLFIEFDQVTGMYLVKHLPVKLNLTRTQFVYWLACCDRAFFPILPIGTTVSLDQGLMPEEIRNQFEAHQHELLVTLTGRKIPVIYNEENRVIDYVGVVYPIGMMPETPTVIISNVMIQQIKHLGLVTDFEKEFTDKLREQQLIESRLSVAYFTEEEEK